MLLNPIYNEKELKIIFLCYHWIDQNSILKALAVWDHPCQIYYQTTRIFHDVLGK